MKDFKKILIIGISGGLAGLTARIFLKKYPHLKIIGVDSRVPRHPIKHENIQYQTIKYTRSNFERIYRDHKFDAVLHLGRLSHADPNGKTSLAKRLDLNIMGTKRILELALQFDVKKIVVMSTYHVYGALPDNPVFLHEDSPLRASFKYPEIRDVTEMDQLCTNWMWRYKDEIEMVVLRPCSIIGQQIKNTMSLYLTSSYAPLPVDYNPMFQFVHEWDMANIIIESVGALPTGVYNVAPDGLISLREAKSLIGKPTIPVPLILIENVAKLVRKVWTFPDYLIDYIKYSSTIDNSSIKKHLGDDIFRFDPAKSIQAISND